MNTIDAESLGGVPLIIRRGTPGDAGALAELAAATFRDAFGADNSAENIALHLGRSFGPERQAAELADPGIATLVVEPGPRLGGYAQLRGGTPPPCVSGAAPLELWRFYVARPWQGRGVAQDLMRRVEEEAKARGARTLWLGVWERNERARAFYRKCGFLDVGSHPYLLGTDPQIDRVLAREIGRA